MPNQPENVQWFNTVLVITENITQILCMVHLMGLDSIVPNTWKILVLRNTGVTVCCLEKVVKSCHQYCIWRVSSTHTHIQKKLLYTETQH